MPLSAEKKENEQEQRPTPIPRLAYIVLRKDLEVLADGSEEGLELS